MVGEEDHLTDRLAYITGRHRPVHLFFGILNGSAALHLVNDNYDDINSNLVFSRKQPQHEFR